MGHDHPLPERSAVTCYCLLFATGEYFVGAEDLHDTTWTTDRSKATVFPSFGAAQAMADAMMRTQGLRLMPFSVEEL
jgi:hypothetical protein